MAENTIDTLKIEVKADTERAIKSLDKLNNRLLKMGDVKINIDFSSLYQLTDIAREASEQLSSLSKTIDTKAFKSLDESVSHSTKVLHDFKNRFGKMTFNAGGLKIVSDYIEKSGMTLGAYGRKLTLVDKNLRSLPKDPFKEYVVEGKTLDGIIESCTRNMDAAKKKAAEMRGAIQGGSQAMVKTAAGKINTNPQQELNQYLKDVDIVGEGKKAKLNFSFKEWKEAKDVIAKLVPISKEASVSLEKLGESTRKTSNGFKNLFNNARGFAKLGIAKAANSFKNAFSGINKQLNYFGAAIKNVLVYSTISKIFSAITKSVKTGTDNLYQYSKIIDGKFASSMDRLASSLQYFQNSIGAAVAPIINSLAPAIDMAVDHIVEFINSLNQLIAKLSGASSWTKAVKVQKEYAEAANSAAEANKGLLAGFDELNVIQPQSGGGSSASTPDYGSMFEEVPLDGYTLPDFVQQIKDQIQAGDWAGVGQTLGEKVNGIVASVNWAAAGENLGEGLQNLINTYNGFMETVDWSGIGSGLGEALNNLMANVDFESMGAAFAQGWNALIELIHGFVTTTDWQAVGFSIAGFINGWFDTIDWALLGQTLSEGIKSLLTALRTTVQEIDWKSIGAYISEALNQIDWSGMFSQLAGLASDGLIALYELLSGFLQGLDWQNLGTELWDSLVGIVTNIDYAGIVSTAFEYLGSAIGAAAGLIQGLATSAWEAIVAGFTATKQYFDKYIEEAGGNVILGVFNGILNALKNVGNWIKENIFTPIVEGFKNAFGIHSPSTVMSEMGGYLIEGLLGGLKNTWNTITTWFTTSVTWIKNKLTTGFTDIKNSVVKIWDGLWSGVKGIINSLLGGVEKMANGIVKGINKIISTFNTLSFDIPDWVPGIGGESFGFNIPSVPEVKIPRLASGGVVTGPTFAQIGEYPGAASNPEIVAPQSVIYDTVVSANGEQERLLREQNSLLRQLLQKESSVTLAPSAALGRVNAKSKQMYEALAGGY